MNSAGILCYNIMTHEIVFEIKTICPYNSPIHILPSLDMIAYEDTEHRIRIYDINVKQEIAISKPLHIQWVHQFYYGDSKTHNTPWTISKDFLICKL